MSAWIDDNDGVYVAGIGMHAYQFPSETPYTHLGLTAVRQALAGLVARLDAQVKAGKQA